MCKTVTIFLAGLLSIATGCTGNVEATAYTPREADSLYTARTAMKIYGTEPERALTIVDSALIVGNVSSFKADFLRAMIYANTVEGAQLNKAIDLCEDLLKHDSTRVVDNSTFANRNDVLGVMMDAWKFENVQIHQGRDKEEATTVLTSANAVKINE